MFFLLFLSVNAHNIINYETKKLEHHLSISSLSLPDGSR